MYLVFDFKVIFLFLSIFIFSGFHRTMRVYSIVLNDNRYVLLRRIESLTVGVWFFG